VVVLLVLALLVVLWTAWDHRAVLERLQSARPLPFFLAMAVLPAVGLPISPLFILAGASFGILIGVLGSAVALAANLSLGYALARLLRPTAERLLRRFGNDRRPVLSGAKERPIRFTVVARLTPGPPQAIVTYALGVAGVPFLPFFVVSMAVTGTYAVLLIVLGESILDHDVTRTLLVVGGLAVVAAVIALVRRHFRRAGTASSPEQAPVPA
jgi:uncharacterized membrane protein YdjX (TVP38/TMEM64 family)